MIAKSTEKSKNMSSTPQIKKVHKLETKKRKAAYNQHLFDRLLETGKDYEEIVIGKKRGIAPKNPIDNMRRSELIGHKHAAIAKKYQIDFANSKKDHHSRPVYDAIRSTSPDFDFYSQSQFEASKRVFLAKNLLAAKQVSVEKNKVIDKKFIKILEAVFEQELSTRNLEVVLKMNYSIVAKKVREICEILEEVYQ